MLENIGKIRQCSVQKKSGIWNMQITPYHTADEAILLAARKIGNWAGLCEYLRRPRAGPGRRRLLPRYGGRNMWRCYGQAIVYDHISKLHSGAMRRDTYPNLAPWSSATLSKMSWSLAVSISSPLVKLGDEGISLICPFLPTKTISSSSESWG